MSNKAGLQIERMDHMVLTVRDMDVTSEFYARVLGMEPIVYGDNRRALRFGQQKINLHRFGNEREPHAFRALPGSADLCFVTGRSMDVVAAHLADQGVEIHEGPVRRLGAVGPITSIYIRDPDQNLIEIARYD